MGLNSKNLLFLLVLMIFCTILTTLGQFFLKNGLSSSLFSLNSNFIFGVILYFFAIFIFLFALKHGELSFIFPLVSLSYIWVTLVSFFYFNEHISLYKFLGVGLIVFGVSLLGKGESK
jgi:undecaprenyl phosphate-alpha-L-ara4N flippase subunit ArnE